MATVYDGFVFMYDDKIYNLFHYAFSGKIIERHRVCDPLYVFLDEDAAESVRFSCIERQKEYYRSEEDEDYLPLPKECDLLSQLEIIPVREALLSIPDFDADNLLVAEWELDGPYYSVG